MRKGKKMNENISIWHKTAQKKQFGSLESSIDVENLIIGGGITGVTTAYCLAKKGIKSLLIEAGEQLCDGTTGNTTAKITVQHGIIYSNIEKKYGLHAAQMYAQSQTEAKNFIKQTVENEKIECDFTENEAFIFAQTEQEASNLRTEYEAAVKTCINAVFYDKPDFPPQACASLGYKNQASFNAVKYVYALADLAVSMGAAICCNTKAEKLEREELIRIICSDGKVINAKNVVMATQYPFFDGRNVFYTKLYAKRSYAVAVEVKRDWKKDLYINVGEPTRSLRPYCIDGRNIIIAVGDDHATGRESNENDDHYQHLTDYANEIAGVKKVLAQWSAQDYCTPDQISYIDEVIDKSRIYAATGFGKWGMTNGTLAGMMIADMIAGVKNKYEELYSLKRSDFFSSAGTVIKEVGASVAELIKSRFEASQDIQNLKQGEGRVIIYKGISAGIYRDYDDMVTILNISCEHMGTVLNFNSLEKTWDCPAHGGRFSTTGELIEGPPKDSLKVLYRDKFVNFRKK